MLGQRRALHEGEHQKHDLEHGFWQRRAPKARSRARFLARGRAPKSTMFGTRESTKKHDFVHEGEHQKARSRARFFARGKTPNSGKHSKQRSPKIYIFFLTVTTLRTDSNYAYQDPPMIRLFVYRFYFIARAVDIRSFAKNCSFAEKCSRGFIPSTLSVGFVTVFEFAFCGYLRFFCANFRWASVASKQTIPVFSRARVAKRK